jgi:hypothetical protein
MGATPPLSPMACGPARNLDRTKVAEVVSALSAPAVIRQVFYGDDLDPARSAGG